MESELGFDPKYSGSYPDASSKFNIYLMKYIKFFENFNTDYLYHGTHEEHKFEKAGMGWYNGTFFSTSENEASSYGKFVYKVKLIPTLNLLDTQKLVDCQIILNEFPELTDTYYSENEEGYYITDPIKLCEHSDSWSPIEYTHGLVKWISVNYDGIWLTEGAVRNLLLFAPIKNKLSEINIC